MFKKYNYTTLLGLLFLLGTSFAEGTDSLSLVKSSDSSVVIDNDTLIAKDSNSVVTANNDSLMAKDSNSVVTADNDALISKDGDSTVATDNDVLIAKDDDSSIVVDKEASIAKKNDSSVIKDNDALVIKEESKKRKLNWQLALGFRGNSWKPSYENQEVKIGTNGYYENGFFKSGNTYNEVSLNRMKSESFVLKLGFDVNRNFFGVKAYLLPPLKIFYDSIQYTSVNTSTWEEEELKIGIKKFTAGGLIEYMRLFPVLNDIFVFGLGVDGGLVFEGFYNYGATNLSDVNEDLYNIFNHDKFIIGGPVISAGSNVGVVRVKVEYCPELGIANSGFYFGNSVIGNLSFHFKSSKKGI